MSVRFRPDRGKYQADVYLRGRRRKPLFLTKREALDFERKCKEKNLGIEDEFQPTLISTAFPVYFETESSQKTEKSCSADKRYLNFAFHFFTVEQGLEYLDDIKLEDLQGFQQWIKKAHKFGTEEKEEWSDSTVARCCKMLKHFFHKMCATRRLRQDPSLYWSIPAGESKRRRPMTAWEFEQVLNASDDWYRPILRFMRMTGARGSSIAALNNEDINLAKRTISLRSAKGSRNKVKTITLPIIDDLFAMFVSIRNERPWAGPAEPVFRDRSNKRINPDWLSKYGNTLIKRVGLEGVVLYGLRHALATDMTEAGISLEVTRQALGHSSVQTTQLYARGVGMNSIAKAIESVRPVVEVSPIVPKKGEGDA